MVTMSLLCPPAPAHPSSSVTAFQPLIASRHHAIQSRYCPSTYGGPVLFTTPSQQRSKVLFRGTVTYTVIIRYLHSLLCISHTLSYPKVDCNSQHNGDNCYAEQKQNRHVMTFIPRFVCSGPRSLSIWRGSTCCAIWQRDDLVRGMLCASEE